MRIDNGLVVGNTYDKYGTSNPIARRLMRGFLHSAEHLAKSTNATNIYEVGCGEGKLSNYFHGLGYEVRGSDVSADVITEARETYPQIEFEEKSIYELDASEHGAELVVCCEVLEHLEEPDKALDVLAQIAPEYLLVSVPREPLWRVLNVLRGKYLTAGGNTPGHLNHWSTRQFVRSLSRRFNIVQTCTPLPWTMVLCSSKAMKS
jgi:2-polyprenyl-3-methyl-5-hydroxy-6-metoxy-1,4-benzoquinol methylase